jgi:DNA polymerase-3 subunit gamma/tau
LSYLSLARKYRPDSFSNLVGQESVGLALANAIRLKREPRGVIFTGVRGVGKTTTARIYAKALNCEMGPTPEPCNRCSSCKAIQHGTHEDVLEIDGASNTGVDDVRALQETLAYVPQRSTFKIYIIDEVHMLSVSAFNALLKTLEEPPEHAVFIFATTELHKVPETIQSRCQVFHLQKISTSLTKKRIAEILVNERIDYEDRAIQWIAREGKGSLRDALTLLDQVIAIGGGRVQWSSVEPLATTGHSEPIFELLGKLIARDSEGILAVIAHWHQVGLPMVVLVEELVKACRNAFILKSLTHTAGELELMDVEESELQSLRLIGESAQVLELNRMFRSFVKCLDDLRGSELDRFVVENYALEWCLDPGLPDLTTIMQGIGGAPRSLASGSVPVANDRSVQPKITGSSASPNDEPSKSSLDLRERWKMASGQTMAPSPVRETSGEAKRENSKAEFSPSIRMGIQSPVLGESVDHVAAKAIAQSHSHGAATQQSLPLGFTASPAPSASTSLQQLPVKAHIQPLEIPPLSPSVLPSIASQMEEIFDSKVSPNLSQSQKDFGMQEMATTIKAQSETDHKGTRRNADQIREKTESLTATGSIHEESLIVPMATVDPPTGAPENQNKVAKPNGSLSRVAAVSTTVGASKTNSIASDKLRETPNEVSTAGHAPEAQPPKHLSNSNWPSSWKDFVERWKKEKPLQARMLEETYAIEYSDSKIKLAVESESLAGQKLLQIDTRRKLLVHFEGLFDFKGIFEVVAKSEILDKPQETLLETKQKLKAREREDLRSLIERHPLTREALSEFDGTIESIEVQ